MGPEDTVPDGGSTASFSAGTVAGAGRPPRSAHAAAAAIASVATAQGTKADARRGGVMPGTAGATSSSSASSIRASAMSCSRCFGSFCRQRPRSRRTRGGTPAGRAAKSGAVFRTAASRSETVSPSKSRRPVSISKRTTPKAQMSARLSTALPRACSGDMYAAVPRMRPAAVPVCASVGDCDRSAEDVTPRPSPRPGLGEAEVEDLDLAVRRQLDVGGLEVAVDDALLVGALERLGDLLRDRRSPRRVAAARASIARRGPRLRPAPAPGTSCPPASSRPWIAATFGWLSAASSCASRRKRASRSGSCATSAGSTLRATSRPSFVSVARYTSPIPPAPRADVIR